MKKTYVLFGIRDDELRSPFVAAFVDAESFEEAAKTLAGTLIHGDNLGWKAHLRLSALLPDAVADTRMFEPGSCTVEVLCGRRTDLATQLERHQYMQYLRYRNERALGFLLACPPD